jgi:hypothetical protein
MKIAIRETEHPPRRWPPTKFKAPWSMYWDVKKDSTVRYMFTPGGGGPTAMDDPMTTEKSSTTSFTMPPWM